MDAIEDLAESDGDAPLETLPRKVLIVSADIGEGHDLPARALAREFQDEDPRALVAIVNSLQAMGLVVTAVTRDGSAWMDRRAPWLFDLQYRLFMDFPPTRWLTRRLLMLFGARGMLRMIRAYEPDLIVSTYPGATELLGELRRLGRIHVPCYASITDLAGLRYWAHPGIDMHFVTYPESIAEVERIAGPGSVRWSRPPTTPAFMKHRSCSVARQSLGLPQAGKVIAVSGGGWGVGDIAGAVATALAADADAQVICICGHNERLRELVTARFSDEPRLRVLGFTRQMSDILTAADALVHSSVGMTLLEALIRGCPVISYGFGYGHVRVANQALERYGLAQVAHSEDELRAALAVALRQRLEPGDAYVNRASTVHLILGNERRSVPVWSWRVRALRLTAAIGATVAACVLIASTGPAYAVVADVAHTRPVTAVTTPKAQVGVLVDATDAQAASLAHMLAVEGIHVTFGVDRAQPALTRGIVTNGDEAVPWLTGDGPGDLWYEQHMLASLGHEMGWQSRRFIYTSSDPSLEQWMVAHHAGGKLVAGKVKVGRRWNALSHLRSGEVIELQVTSLDGAITQLLQLDHQLRADHLRAVPIGQLIRESGLQV
jgi:processive 1,2-diacylglycerol beta-glucosyltransferase